MPTNELDDLLATVEAARLDRHPTLDADFLRAIVKAEEQNPRDDAAAIRAIEQALKSSLAAMGGRDVKD